MTCAMKSDLKRKVNSLIDSLMIALTCICSLLWIILFAFLIFFFSSCKTQYIPVESVRTEIEYRDRLQRDSIYVSNDTNTRQEGDTVYIERLYREYRDRYIRDTINIYRTDSIQVPYPVERQLGRWERIKIEIGGIAIGAIVVLLIIVTWLVFKKRNKV